MTIFYYFYYSIIIITIFLFSLHQQNIIAILIVYKYIFFNIDQLIGY